MWRLFIIVIFFLKGSIQNLADLKFSAVSVQIFAANTSEFEYFRQPLYIQGGW